MATATRAPKRARKPQRTSTTAQSNTTAPDGYMSRAQAAAFCGGVNLQIIDSAIRRGDLKAYKPKGRKGEGRRVLIRKTDLVAWVESQQV